MKAFILKEPGGIENLLATEIEKPIVGDSDVLIKTKALSINPVDVKSRKGSGVYGRLKTISPLILGWDISGEVVETGKNVTAFKKGDAVFGMINFPGHGKAYAEYAVAPESELALKPSNISHEEAAAATLAALTAWQVFQDYYTLKAGDKILIHAAAGGVGHFAVQLAKLKGAYVIGTGSASNKEFILSLGADEFIDYTSENFEDRVRELDMVFDTIGGETMKRSLNVLKKGGSIVTIPSGMSPELKELSEAKGVQGIAMLVKSNGIDMNALAELLKSGKLKAHVSKQFTFDQIGEAHTAVETGRTRGKVVVQI